MPPTEPADRGLSFEDAAAALQRGDFSWLAPVFEAEPHEPSCVAQWLLEGRFNDRPAALNEALACACFLGETALAELLLDQGADLLAGQGTGLNGLHWAANRGQLKTVQMLIARGLPLEVRNMYGGTVLGGTVWSAVHEPRAGQLAVIEALLQAGADVGEAAYPSGDPAVDALLARYLAGP
ncbi:ankyrin repeat domain-containing protein [Pelomonas sp. V22]|uniref:ankyrin repeat domain-containing protein n=1 Tax=Pelomonas sp. V22 TaxID=2822139 RepID=UPI0024A9D2FF|nr:ankyrin repeat domain-containing protein [Pelomonas sp. V22]MDI4634308.1 ankyrin repeat domain-containing protein [Pelomonas sp. V22]